MYVQVHFPYSGSISDLPQTQQWLHSLLPPPVSLIFPMWILQAIPMQTQKCSCIPEFTLPHHKPFSYLLSCVSSLQRKLKENILCSSLFSIFLASIYSSASSHLYFDSIILLKQFFEKLKYNFKTKHLKIFSCFVLMNFCNSWYYYHSLLKTYSPLLLRFYTLLVFFQYLVTLFQCSLRLSSLALNFIDVLQGLVLVSSDYF